MNSSSITQAPLDNPASSVTNSSKLVEARRRLPLNLLSNSSWFLINLVVGLWYTPFLISHLGVAVYGLIPLASSITNYLSLITDGFNSAVSRFLQIELAKEDVKAANRIFNTSVAGALSIFSAVIPIAIVVSNFAPQIFDVPTSFEQNAQWLVLLTMVAFGFNFLSSSFAISSFASHRFDLRLLLNIIRLTVQMGSVVFFFSIISPNLWQVGFGILLSSILYLLGHRLLSKRLTPFLKINFQLFDFGQLKQMLQFSGWVLVNQVGAHLFLSIDLIVANLVFGAYVAGRYGAVMIFTSLLRSMVGTISAVLDPIVFTLFGQNRLKDLAQFSNLSVKFMGLLIALPIGLICGFAKPILIVWLGPEFADLSWLVIALTGHLCINLSVVPLFPIQVSTNHVRLPGTMTLLMGILNAGLAYSLARWSGMGFISIAIAGAIVLSLKNGLFTPLYNAHLLHLPWWTFLRSIATSVIAWAVVFGISYWLSLEMNLNNLFFIAFTCMALSGIYMSAIYFVGLSKAEKELISVEIRNRLGR